MTRFGTVLVANRGEIALRVIRAVAGAGLRSVAVYSDADRDAPHVRAADDAVRIGPAAAAQSYLSIAALMDAAARSGADALHPGYGFLSERPELARATDRAGLVFIGPSAVVMETMGRKDAAREVAVAAGLPVVPAADLTGVDPATPGGLAEIGGQVGFPLLVKAAAGGGGKGMRVVRAPGELADAVSAARRESLAAFGDDTMLFERYVESGRHIEVQVLADEQGAVVHLYDRDCSVQRRHQKVIEEAPATSVPAGVRKEILSAAVALAKQVGYVNAGTVEFLVAGDDAYFLEMNTRLQVEHPVTELVTGLDLVRLQLSIAQGEPLPFGQHEVTVRGHAIEARVYAEDPSRGFLPQAGVAELVDWPTGVRVDEALESGQLVGTHYDPMLAKVIASGPSREAARRRLVTALDDTAILGLTTNLGFLRTLVGSDAFGEAAIDTGWLDLRAGELSGHAVPEVAWLLAAWSVALAAGSAASGPLAEPDGWRLGGPAAGIPVSLSLAGDGAGASAATVAEARLLTVHPGDGVVVVDGRRVATRVARREGARLWIEVDDVVEVGHVVVRPHQVLTAYRGQTYVFQPPDAFGPAAHADAGDGSILAPMPGTVLGLGAAAGAAVCAGDMLVVLEAMKMELALKAPFAGTVASVEVAVGDQVRLGARLVVVESADDPAAAAAR